MSKLPRYEEYKHCSTQKSHDGSYSERGPVYPSAFSSTGAIFDPFFADPVDLESFKQGSTGLFTPVLWKIF